jgi:shikimate kinase
VALLGLMGAGKSTHGHALAARLSRPFLDNDARLEAHAGRTARLVAAESGRAALHALEAALLREALASPAPAVVAVAGSAVLDAGLRALLRERALCVWLDVPAEVLARRVLGPHGTHRPFLEEGDPLAALQAMDLARRPLFEATAHLVLAPSAPGYTLAAAVERVAAALAGA